MPYIGNPIYQSAFVTDTFSGTGSQTAFTMSVAPAGTTNVLVVVSGVVQDPSTYGVVGNTLNFSTAPPSGTNNISCRYLGVPVTGVATSAYRTVTVFTATANQTTFTPPSYTVGFIEVNRNGVLLTPTTDYTATNGTTVVLATGATAGDTIQIISFLVSSVLNAVPQSGGTISGNLVVTGTETVGGGTPLGGTTNPILASVAGSSNYVQTYIYNSTNGGSSSADLVAYPNNGTDSHGWVDMGITSQSYSDSTYTCTGPNEAYLFGSAPTGAGATGNLVYATDSTGSANAHQWYVGGFTQAKSAYKMQLDSSGNLTLNAGKVLNSSGRPMVNQTGGILQVVTVQVNARYNVTTTSFAGVGPTLSITPSSTSSRIFLLATMSIQFPAYTYMTFFRNGTNVSGAAQGIITYGGSSGWTNDAISYVDSPATSSAITYQLAMYSSSGTISLNDYSAGNNWQIIAMEIAG